MKESQPQANRRVEVTAFIRLVQLEVRSIHLTSHLTPLLSSVNVHSDKIAFLVDKEIGMQKAIAFVKEQAAMFNVCDYECSKLMIS